MTEEIDEATKPFWCSMWAKGPSPQQVLDKFFKDLSDSYNQIKSNGNVEWEEDVSYGDDESQKVDIWGRVDDKLLVFFHGGYWQEGTRKFCLSPADVAFAEGFAIASVGYRLASPKCSINHTVEDAINGTKFLLERYPNVTTVVVGGHSAGAHLAFQVVTKLRSEKIRGLALFAGVYHLDELVNTKVGRGAGLTAEEAKKNNCEFSSLDGLPLKTMLLLGNNDAPKLVEQNLLLIQTRPEVNFKEYPDLNHFTVLTETADNSSKPARDFHQFLRSCPA